MNKLLIISMFFLFSCSQNISRANFDFSDELTFDEFKLKLEEYAKKTPYPNIDD